jgi:hypothetical protein
MQERFTRYLLPVYSQSPPNLLPSRRSRVREQITFGNITIGKTGNLEMKTRM